MAKTKPKSEEPQETLRDSIRKGFIQFAMDILDGHVVLYCPCGKRYDSRKGFKRKELRTHIEHLLE